MLVISRVNYTLQRCCYVYEFNLIHDCVMWKAIEQIFNRFESTCINNSKFYWKCETGNWSQRMAVITDVICIDSFIHHQANSETLTDFSGSQYNIQVVLVRRFELNALLIAFSSCSFWKRTTERQCINYRCYWISTTPYSCTIFK